MRRQIVKTRASIGEAFQALVFCKRYDDIRMSDVARSANVGRSTLYMHFKDKDAILVASMQPILKVLASSVSGPRAGSGVVSALDHIWSHRDRGRTLLFGVSGAKLESALETHILELLEQSDPAPSPLLVAKQVSASLFSALRAWVRGEVSVSAVDLAGHLCATSVALIASARR